MGLSLFVCLSVCLLLSLSLSLPRPLPLSLFLFLSFFLSCMHYSWSKSSLFCCSEPSRQQSAVSLWLSGLGLGGYTAVIESNGFDHIQFLVSLS